MTPRETRVDGRIPVLWTEPEQPSPGRPAALWLPHLTGTKESYLPVLRKLAGAGFLAVSLDPWEHGERGTESRDELFARVMGGFRREMWPILGQTTLDALRVLDWAAAELGAGPGAVAGGVSMGGDIAVALAGVDPRIGRVAALVSTPDWTRPGMRALDDPERVLDQGEAGAYAQWFRDRLDPSAHRAGFAHGPAIAFECGGADEHIRSEWAERFREAYPAGPERVRVTVHPGFGHLEGARDEALLARCVEFLAG